MNTERVAFENEQSDFELDDSVKNSWVLFKLCEREFGLPTRLVIQMVNLAKYHTLPDQPEYVRGAMNLRGEIITLIDLNILLGRSCEATENEQLIQLLAAREEDHVKWLNELFQSVQENREFKLTTDPHACTLSKNRHRSYIDALF